MGKTQYTTYTPLPPGVPRLLAIDMLHSHGEIIELNPLVLEHHPVKAPKNAAPDEFFAVWHEITERIQYIPGMGKMGSGKISFKGVFHDMPWGLQTHIYAPAGVDLRNKYQIKGNQPGEPREPRELGDRAPLDGLYLQEDIEITCNFTMIPFVKKSMKAAAAVLVARLVKKAELLDAGQLQAMIENGRLKTVNPAVQNQFASPPSPKLPSQMPFGPGQTPYSPGAIQSNDLISSQMLSHSNSVRNSYYPQHQQLPDPSPSPNLNNNPINTNNIINKPGAYARQTQYTHHTTPQFAVEMPGSYHYNQPPPNPQYLQSQNNRYSAVSELSGTSPRQASFSSPHTDGSSPRLGGGQSPRVGGGGGSVHGGSQYSDTTATSELPSQMSGGYLKPMVSPGLLSDRDRFSVVSEMPTSER
jgi:hypothetical protein